MIKVTIERHCHQGKERQFEELLIELRAKVVRQPGYHSGETLRGVDDPLLWLVISSWVSLEEWLAWQRSQERQEIIKKIEPLLDTPVRETVFEATSWRWSGPCPRRTPCGRPAGACAATWSSRSRGPTKQPRRRRQPAIDT